MFDETTNTRTAPELDRRLVELGRYWDQLRGNRVVPGRVDIRPTEISRHLSRIGIVERPRAGTVRLRLVGAHLSQRLEMELRGMPFRALFDLDDRAAAMSAAEIAIATPCISLLELAHRRRGVAVREGHMMILPLSDTTGALTRAMVVFSEHKTPEPLVPTKPGRFTITNSWQFDIPETGPAFGSDLVMRPVVQRIQRDGAQIQAPRIHAPSPVATPEADTDAFDPQPVHRPSAAPFLRVIEGGKA